MKGTSLFISLCLIAATNLFGSEPFFTSGPTVQPDTGIVNQPITFSVAASTADNAALTYTWYFGDGATGDGATVTHSYTVAGIYDVSLAVRTPQGNTTGDRFELPVVNSGTIVQTHADKASAKVSSATGKDSFSFRGVAQNVPAGISPANQTVTVNVMGVISQFAVNSKGQGKSDSGTIKFKLPKNGTGGNIPVSLSLKKSTFLHAMIAAGFDPTSADVQQVDFLTVISFGPPNGRSALSRETEEQFTTFITDVFFAVVASGKRPVGLGLVVYRLLFSPRSP